MRNQKVSTGLGTIVLVIIAITVGAFVWVVIKNREVMEAPQSVAVQPKPVKKNQEQQNQAQQQENKDNELNCLPDNNSEKIEWKTFKNDQYKFEFQYPSNFIYSEHISSTPEEIMRSGTNYSISMGKPNEIGIKKYAQCFPDNNFSIHISNNENGLDEHIKNASNTSGAVERSFQIINTEKVGGIVAKVAKTCDMGGYCNKTIFFMDKKYIYSIYLRNYFTLKDPTDKQIIDRIITSFTFTN